MLKLFASAMAAASVAVLPVGAAAQEYPAKSIKLIVPFPAGGPADTIARTFSEKFSAVVGQPVVIENRGGAGGVTGISQVAKSDPDGYTLGVASAGALAISAALGDKMPYDPLKDLTLVSQIASVPELLVVGPQVPAKTLNELVALAKAQPGKLNFASTGLGSMPHMAAELFKITAAIDIVHVPYAGAAPALNDLLGGHVQMLFADVPVLLGNVQSGKLRALAVGSKVRVPVLPDVPTTTEAGMAKVEADNWYGIVSPANVAAPVAAKLFKSAVETITSPEVADRLGKVGVITVGSTTAEFTGYVRSEIERWAAVGKSAGIKLK